MYWDTFGVIMIHYMNLYECQEHVDLSTPCLIILVTINAMDIV